MTLRTRIKYPSSILTLAALGVCLGLILAGPSPASSQISVQQRPERVQKGSGDQKRDSGKAVEQFAATLEDLYRIASEIADTKSRETGKSEFSLSYFVAIKVNGTARFTAHPLPGQDGAEWSGRYREPLMSLFDAFLPRTEDWNDDLLVQFDLGPNDVTLKATILTNPGMDGSSLTGFDRSAFLQKAAGSDLIRSHIYGASEVTVQKNKIIVVANLPRAGLESLLTRSKSDR